MSTRAKVMDSEDLCEECPLTGSPEWNIGGAVYPGGWPFIRETPQGLEVTWNSGDELHLERWQVVELHRVLEEHAGRWR